MQEQLQAFTHHEIQGAVIRVLADERLSVNEFLEKEHHLEFGDEYAFAYTCCYVRHRGCHILIDAGFEPDTPAGALEAMDVAPDEVGWVLLTHVDRDHAAGLLLPDGSLAYPSARHVVAKELWDHLCRDETLTALAPDREAFYRRLLVALESKIELVHGMAELSDGIRFIPCPGHRIGHGAYELACSHEPLIHSGDAFFHPLFAEHPDWRNVADSMPAQAAKSRRHLVEHIVRSEALVLSSHMPFPGIGRIRRTGEAFDWQSPVESQE